MKKIIIVLIVLTVLVVAFLLALILRGSEDTVTDTTIIEKIATPSATLAPNTRTGTFKPTPTQTPRVDTPTTGGSTTIINNNPPAQPQPNPTPEPTEAPKRPPFINLPLPTIKIGGLEL